MWLSEQRSRRPAEERPAELGVVTLTGEAPAVWLTGERREVPVLGPGGYCWRPSAGDEVLVLKAGAEGEQPWVAGQSCGWPEELQPGDVGIYAGQAAVVLKAGGTVDLRGSVTIDGVPLEELFAPKEEGGEIVDGGETGTGTGTGTGSGSGGGGGA